MKKFVLVVVVLILPSTLAMSRSDMCALPEFKHLCGLACAAPNYTPEPQVTYSSTCSSRTCDTPLCSAVATETPLILEKFMAGKETKEIYHLGQDIDSNFNVIHTCAKQNATLTTAADGTLLYSDIFTTDRWNYRELCNGALEIWWADPSGLSCYYQHWERRIFHPNYDIATGKQIGDKKVKFYAIVECRLDLPDSVVRYIKVNHLSQLTKEVKQWITDNIPGLDVEKALNACKEAGIY